MKIVSAGTLGLIAGLSMLGTGQASAQALDIASSGDWGNSHPSYPPSNAVDGNTAFSSRWAATFDGGSANLWVDLGRVVSVGDVGIAWGRGNQRSYVFEVWARARTSGSWTKIFDDSSGGRTADVESYDVDDMDARQVRVKVFSNSAGTDWADITEFEVRDASGGVAPPENVFSVPGLVQAEDFSAYSDADTNNRGGRYRDTGVDIESCSDANCGYNVGWMIAGEWLEYELDVRVGGNYEARLRVASPRATGAVYLSVDGSRARPTLVVGNTGGWQAWRTRTIGLGKLDAGRHTLRLTVASSDLNLNWINVVRSADASTSSLPPPPEPSRVGDFGLNPNVEPWENFDLRRWALDTPAPRDDDRCRAERTWDYSWSGGDPLDSSSAPFFFTHDDGGMRFRTRIDGQTTSDDCGAGYVRSELREMIRAGNRSIEDTGVSRNNWKLGYQPGSDGNWGGVNGQLDGTLRVNRVTTTGSGGQVGRVIIGQIHAGNDEPLRLYYRKRSGQSKGCIYFGHEIRDGDDEWFDLIGDQSCTSGPSDGIALDELFSYSIVNDDEDITVIVRRGDRDGSIIAQRTIDMNTLNSGYDRSDEWMYFKAGAYTQNNSGSGSDGDIVTFYRLSVFHD